MRAPNNIRRYFYTSSHGALLVVMVAATAHGMEEYSARSPEYELSGIIIREGTLWRTNETSYFQCRVSGNRWYIKVVDAPLTPRLEGEGGMRPQKVASSDGTNFFHIDTLGARCRAVLGPGVVPFGVDERILGVWYSFASFDYLRQAPTNGILPLHYVSIRDVQSGELFASARWELSPDEPRLPRVLETSNYFALRGKEALFAKSSFSHTNVSMRVTAYTNFLNWTIPSNVAIDYSVLQDPLRHKRIFMFKDFTLRIIVESVRLPAEAHQFYLPLLQPARFEDYSYWLRDPPHQVILNTTNGWPDVQEREARYLDRKARGNDISAPPPKTEFVSVGILLSAICFGLVAWRTGRKREKQTKGEKV